MEQSQIGADRAFRNHLVQPLGLSVETMRPRKGRIPTWHSPVNQQQSWPFNSGLFLSSSMFLLHSLHSSCTIIWYFIFSIPRSPIIPCSSTENALLNTHKLTFDMLKWHISNREGPLSLKRLEKFLPKAPYSYASLALLASSTWPFGSSKAKDLAKVSLWLRSHWIWVAILAKEMGVYLGPLGTDKLN